jgi:phthalate 4,5-dioxygenase oxygenase subunit
MLSVEDNELLCRVEGDAAMGQLMRRHWIPACLSEEVAERDGAPVRVRLLGEDLVAFRDTAGRIGVLNEHCPNRRASHALCRNEECGLRCSTTAGKSTSKATSSTARRSPTTPFWPKGRAQDLPLP